MKYLLSLVVIALICTSCQSFREDKKDKYYESYYRPEGTKTPQEQVR
jgi:hypothetical protein